MRTILLHLWETDETAVARALSVAYPSQARPWICFAAEDPCLYIDFYHDGPLEDQSWSTKFESQGSLPSVSVAANVSGRHDGWPQIQSLVALLLGEFGGVAEDDDSERLWSHEEIQQDLTVDGKRFGSWRS